MTEQKKEYKIAGRPSTIFRVEKNTETPYVMIDRRPIGNPDLSFKAKGILTYLMSRPDGWEVNITDLLKHGKDGEAAIRSGLKELREAGHMKYETSRNEGRITGWIIRVYEVPEAPQQLLEAHADLIETPDSDFQQVENQDIENQDVENSTQVLKNLSSKELKPDTYIPPVQKIELAETEEPITAKDPVIQSVRILRIPLPPHRRTRFVGRSLHRN